MGSQTYWFGLRDHTYYSWEQLDYYRRFAPGSPLEVALAEFAPDVFVLDGHMREYLVEGNETTLYSDLSILSRSDLEGILDRHGVLVDDFDGGSYGRVQIYRMDWSSPRTNLDASHTSASSSGDPLASASPNETEKRVWVANED
jgi:hypothetical protein